MSDGVTFGGWLKQRRKELGVNQEQLAERIGCSRITVAKLESGERRPSGQVALLLAGYFRIPSNEHEAFVTFARSLPSASASSSAPATGEIVPLAPWRGVDLRQSNLPASLTTLIGREADVEAAREHLLNSNVRLLTLTGAPGIGKTRLGLRVASDVVGHFEDGVFLVELAPVADPDLVLLTIARTLGVSEQAALPLEESLLAYIRNKRLLLLLDNFEQVLDAAPGVVKLMQACPWLKVLVTSREALGVRGERRFQVRPLPLPPVDSAIPDPISAMRSPAVRLFVERAQDVQSDFELTSANVQDVVALCVGLDGLPLAIELAAAHANMLSATRMRNLLGKSLKAPTLIARDLPPRQRTLRAAIEWSYNLLDPLEQKLYSRLGIFVGGSTLEAIEAVCNYDGSLERLGLGALGEGQGDALDGVESLVNKSLLLQQAGSKGEPRFLMLETIHEHTRDKLQESGEADALHREHALYFMRLALQAELHFRSEREKEWLDVLEADYDNLRAALAWSDEQARRGSAEAAEIGMRTAGAVWRLWSVRGMWTEGRERLERILSAPEAVLQACSPTARANLMNRIGLLACLQGDYSLARPVLEGALALGREAGDKRTMTSSLNILSFVDHGQGDFTRARTLLEESLDLQRELGNKVGIAIALHNIGLAAFDQGDYAEARALFEESLALSRELGYKLGIAPALGNLGDIAAMEGDYAMSRALHEESLALSRELGNKMGIAYSLNCLGDLARYEGDHAMSRALYEESLALRRELGDKPGIAASLSRLGWLALGAGDLQKGATLLGAAEGLLQSIGAWLVAADRLSHERAMASARALLGMEAFERARQDGKAISMERAIEYALEDTCSPGTAKAGQLA